MKRLYFAAIFDHFREDQQMLFLMGPRQVGKTTTCLSLQESFDQFFYLTWDAQEDQRLIILGPKALAEALGLTSLLKKKPLVVFDEIHKYERWKEFLKGFYDLYSKKCHILVTGSARLDVYKRGGDSLMGRYFLYRFHPLSVAEIIDYSFPTKILRAPKQINENSFKKLWEFGGYPDPYLKANIRFFNRWSKLRFQLLFQEEIRDLTRIQEIKQLEILAMLLKEQVGGQTSYDELAKKTRVTGHTIRKWIETLHSLYYCFEIRPWSTNVSRSLLKEPKYYLWDWSQISDPGARAENFIASHLLKAVHFWSDAGIADCALYYLRDKQKREVDFLVTRNGNPWFLVEAKYSDNKGVSPFLHYFQKALGAQHAFQVVIDLPYVNRSCFEETDPIIVPARTFLSQLV